MEANATGRGGAKGRRPAATAGSPFHGKPFAKQLDRAAAALESALAGEGLASFYAALRATELPFVAAGGRGRSRRRLLERPC